LLGGNPEQFIPGERIGFTAELLAVDRNDDRLGLLGEHDVDVVLAVPSCDSRSSAKCRRSRESSAGLRMGSAAISDTILRSERAVAMSVYVGARSSGWLDPVQTPLAGARSHEGRANSSAFGIPEPGTCRADIPRATDWVLHSAAPTHGVSH
jgi:hypothetical protein